MSGPLLTADDPRAPKYWMYETSGLLGEAVRAYLENAALTEVQISYLRAYLRQWIMSPVWNENPYGTRDLEGLRDGINSLTNRAQIATWINRAVAIGIDPL